MVRRRHWLLLILATCTIAGCALLHTAYRVQPLIEDSQTKPKTRWQIYNWIIGRAEVNPIDLATYYYPMPSPASVQLPTVSPTAPALALAAQQSAGDAPAAPTPTSTSSPKATLGRCNLEPGKTAYEMAFQSEGCRNELLSRLIRQSNEICNIHKSNVIAQAAATNLVLGAAALGLTGAGAVAGGGVTVVQSISAAAAGVTGAKSLINNEIYQQQLTSVIVQAISTARAKERAAIEAHFTDSLADYPVERGIVDVEEYHHDCSFSQGLVLLSEAVDRSRQSPTVTATVTATASATPTATKKK